MSWDLVLVFRLWGNSLEGKLMEMRKGRAEKVVWPHVMAYADRQTIPLCTPLRYFDISLVIQKS